MYLELQKRTSECSSIAICNCSVNEISLGYDGVYITIGHGLFDVDRRMFFDYAWFDMIYEVSEDQKEFRLIWSEE